MARATAIPSKGFDGSEVNNLAFHNLRQTSLRSRLTTYRVQALAAAGRIRTKALPGVPLRFCLQDALACAGESQS